MNDTLAQQRSLSDLQAAILLNAIKYIDWPDSPGNERFVMTISGDDNLSPRSNKLFKTNKKTERK